MSDINEKSNFVFEFQPVTKLFEEQVRLHPDKCAVAYNIILGGAGNV